MSERAYRYPPTDQGGGLPHAGFVAASAGLAGVLIGSLVAGCTGAASDPTRAAGRALLTTTVSSSTAPSPSPSPADPPDAAKVKSRLAKVSRNGIRQRRVVSTTTALLITGRSANRALAPASTMKVLTTLAAVDVLGADHRFTTSVVASGKAKIVLVGGAIRC